MGDRPSCKFEGCVRVRVALGYCKTHWKQWTTHGEVWVIGDKAHLKAQRRAHWASLSEEERAARLAPMVASIKGKPRSPQHAARLSESIRARLTEGGFDIPDRECRGCGETFTPASGSNFWCANGCQEARKRLRRHGLTNRQYLDLLESQGGKCALCRESGKGYGGSRYALVVDHCHATGKVRGLLCPDCNTALGRFGDDAARLRAAADYIERTSS